VAAARLSELERILSESSAADGLVIAAAAAGRTVALDPDEARAVVRRALFVHAAGGDALRAFELEGRAVLGAAEDLESSERRAELVRGLDRFRLEAAGFPSLERTIETLVAEPDLAWRAYACSVLLEGLEEDG
jgi:hypothetical protein